VTLCRKDTPCGEVGEIASAPSSKTRVRLSPISVADTEPVSPVGSGVWIETAFAPGVLTWASTVPSPVNENVRLEPSPVTDCRSARIGR
jgi:hypothetical protein